MEPPTERIPAIVLTYDCNRPFTEHMIAKYTNLWPDHPFEFRVPFQERETIASPTALPVLAPEGIRASVLTLCEKLEDQQWIYWCIDDKYPINLDFAWSKKLVQFIRSGKSEDVDGLCACRARGLKGPLALRTGRFGLYETSVLPNLGVFFRRRNYSQIWLHQFLRVRVLRHLFESLPGNVTGAKKLDEIKDRIQLPENHRIFVSRVSHIDFGESASRGFVTQNCLTSMRANNIEYCEPRNGAAPPIMIEGVKKGSWLRSPLRESRDALSTWVASCGFLD